MKKLVLGTLALILLAGYAVAAVPAQVTCDIPLKNIYSAPDSSSNLVYAVPIEVRVLDISADNNWYKVKISYRLGPLSTTVVGWTEIPVGEVITARQKAMDDVARAPLPSAEEQIE